MLKWMKNGQVIARFYGNHLIKSSIWRVVNAARIANEDVLIFFRVPSLFPRGPMPKRRLIHCRSTKTCHPLKVNFLNSTSSSPSALPSAGAAQRSEIPPPPPPPPPLPPPSSFDLIEFLHSYHDRVDETNLSTSCWRAQGRGNAAAPALPRQRNHLAATAPFSFSHSLWPGLGCGHQDGSNQNWLITNQSRSIFNNFPGVISISVLGFFSAIDLIADWVPKNQRHCFTIQWFRASW